LTHELDATHIFRKASSRLTASFEGRLFKYEEALQRHGVKTIAGELKLVLDWKTALAGSAAEVAHHGMGLLTAGMLVSGRLVVS